MRQWLLQPSMLKIFGAPLVVFAMLGVWLALDLRQGYEKTIADTALRAMHRSQIVSQSFRTKILASDYVLSDVLGRIQERDLVYPDPDPDHAQRMTKLLKEKADTVPDFFSMVVYNRDCVFTATVSGNNTGVQSKQALCEARKRHLGTGALVSYVPGTQSATKRPVLVLSRHLRSPAGDFLGGVLGVAELHRAQQLFDVPGLDPGDSVALLDKDKVLLARYPLLAEAIEKHATTLVIPPEFNTTETDALISDPVQVDVDHRERIFGFSKIADFPFLVAFGIHKITALEAWKRRAVELTIGYFVMLLLSLWAARSQCITLRQREALRASEEHFRLLAENMVDIVWKTDAKFRLTYINRADQTIRGFAREEVMGTYFGESLTPQGKDILAEKSKERRAIERSAHKGMALKYDLPMRHKQRDDVVWIEMSSVPIYGSDGHINGYQGVGRDVSARRQSEANLLRAHQALETQLLEVVDQKSALEELATRDPLTGVYNRRYLDETLPRELSRARREHCSVAVIMTDLDHFKHVNDTYSHAAGDEVLKTFTAFLKKSARDSDMICRYGGEEFALIMPGMSQALALERMEVLRLEWAHVIVPYEEHRIRVTLSAGIACFPEHGGDMLTLFSCADAMLYRSKREGRNRVFLWGTEVDDVAVCGNEH